MNLDCTTYILPNILPCRRGSQGQIGKEGEILEKRAYLREDGRAAVFGVLVKLTRLVRMTTNQIKFARLRWNLMSCEWHRTTQPVK